MSRRLRMQGLGALVFFDNTAYLKQLETTGAAACLVGKKHKDKVPQGVAVLVCDDAYRSWAKVLAHLFPTAMSPKEFASAGVSDRSVVDPTATLEDNVTIEAGAVVGADVEIGSGTVIRSNAVIGRGVKIGRDCVIGPNCTVQHSVLGNRVAFHPGVCCGQDGFGYAMGAQGHLKVPQVGRVIVQDDVEVGANTTIDRVPIGTRSSGKAPRSTIRCRLVTTLLSDGTVSWFHRSVCPEAAPLEISWRLAVRRVFAATSRSEWVRRLPL